MKRGWLWIAIGLLLSGTLVMARMRPREMLSPGDLAPAHARLNSKCFACHTPFQGASAQRCMTCHKIEDIGIRTPFGKPLEAPSLLPPFHQTLTSTDCMACHSDHPAPPLTELKRTSFDHALLAPELRNRCAACHGKTGPVSRNTP